MSDDAFPMYQRLKPAPGIRQLSHGLHLSFAHLVVRFGCPLCVGPKTPQCAAVGVGFYSAPGALAPVRVMLSRSINACRPHPTYSPAHRDFAVSATYTRCLRCAGAPRRPASGSELSLHIPSRHAVLYAPGEIEIRFIQITDFDIGLRRDLSGSALPVILPSASSRARFRGFLIRISLRPVQLLASLDGSDRDSLSHRGFYVQAFHESVSLLAAGYHYDSHWSVLSVGLSPTGMAASLAAPEPYERHYRIRLKDVRLVHRCRVGGGAPKRWPPSAAQTARTVFPYAAFTKTRHYEMREKELTPPSSQAHTHRTAWP
jgi:hypothetical protein